MFGNILSTFFSRVLSMLIMFGIVILNARIFGAEGVGTIGLIILNISILQLVTSFIGGTTLVYLIPRREKKQLLIYSFVWATVGNILGLLVLDALSLVPQDYFYLLMFTSIVFSYNSINLTVLQAFERIKIFNVFQVSQSLLLILFVLIGLLWDRYSDNYIFEVKHYFYAFLSSYLITFLISAAYVIRLLYQQSQQNLKALEFESKTWINQLKEMLSLGAWVQIANLAQLLNYRLSYYFIEWFVGRKPLGIYDMGTKISEAIWVFPKSLCLVQYARLSNNTDKEYAKKITLIFAKIASFFTLLVLIVLLVLPTSFYTMIFGMEFADVKTILLALAPGIFLLSILTVFSHHLAAKGAYWKNAVSSLAGLIITVIGGYFLIPIAAQSGFLNALFIAGIITSVSYLTSFLITIYFFHIDSQLKIHDFLISEEELLLLKSELKKIFKRNPNP
ncbi:MAG: hypothetical protein RBS29_09000 [Bacteroidales bacterium]|jgi:O-antigen/teichoic acid export membrane protein|nr:hypothetical protein [Bacteroidales bacterium]